MSIAPITAVLLDRIGFFVPENSAGRVLAGHSLNFPRRITLAALLIFKDGVRLEFEEN
jgi:hypothetical protein